MVSAAMKTLFMGILYGGLGGVMADGGIRGHDWHFWAVLGLVMVIDLSSHLGARE